MLFDMADLWDIACSEHRCVSLVKTAFCGADVAAYDQVAGNGGKVNKALLKTEVFPKPTAAVNGDCVAGGVNPCSPPIFAWRAASAIGLPKYARLSVWRRHSELVHQIGYVHAMKLILARNSSTRKPKDPSSNKTSTQIN